MTGMSCVADFQIPSRFLTPLRLLISSFQIIPYWLLLMERLFLLFLSKAFLRILLRLSTLFSNFSLTILSAAHLIVHSFVNKRPYVLLLISNLFLLLHIILTFPILFLQIWIEFQSRFVSSL